MITRILPFVAATVTTLGVCAILGAQPQPRPAPVAKPAPASKPAPATTPPTPAPATMPRPDARPAPESGDAWHESIREAQRAAFEGVRESQVLSVADAREAAQLARVEAMRAVEGVRRGLSGSLAPFTSGSFPGDLSALSGLSALSSLDALSSTRSMSALGIIAGDFNERGMSYMGRGRRSFAEQPRDAWAGGDPADSVYRLAREQLNRGDYRRAAALFKDIPARFPTSAYAAESPYWQAFCLYRIGSTSDLQEALQALETQKSKYPGARSQADASALAARIAGVLSGRGQGGSALVKSALNAGGDGCDREDQSVRAEALSALTQTEPDEASKLAQKILGRKDECSSDLRRSAVYLVGNRRDAAAATSLIQVARNDPSMDVRVDAISWLPKVPGDDALSTLEDIASRGDDERLQRAAVRALTVHANPRARLAMRSLVERNEANEKLRITVLDAFDSERATSDDATWMRAIYAKVDNQRVKARIASTVGRLGGDANNQWLLVLARNESEGLETRANALRYVARTMEIPALGKFYDGVAERPLREQLIDVLGNRRENEATDKLIEIARTGTDPQLRRAAIAALTRKKDPRTTKLLLEIIDR